MTCTHSASTRAKKSGVGHSQRLQPVSDMQSVRRAQRPDEEMQKQSKCLSPDQQVLPLSHIRAILGTYESKQAYTPLGKRPGSTAQASHGDCMEHIATSKGSLFQAWLCTRQVHYEEPDAVLPGSFPNGVYACFDSQVPNIARMCEGVGDVTSPEKYLREVPDSMAHLRSTVETGSVQLPRRQVVFTCSATNVGGPTLHKRSPCAPLSPLGR